MIVSLIAALDLEGTIGRSGELPWRLPDDLRRFKRLTTGKPVVMGRKTYESIGRPLPKRTNIVLTGQAGYEAPGCVVVHGVEDALDEARLAAAGAPEPEVMIFGGAIVYALFLPRADRFYLTRVDARVDGDTHFPLWDPAEWRETERVYHAADSRHDHPFVFMTLVRDPGGPR